MSRWISLNCRRSVWIVAVLGLAVVLVGSSWSFADQSEDKTEDKNQAAEKVEEKAEAEQHPLPDGGPTELIKFIEKLEAIQLRSKRSARTIHGRVVEAAERILSDKAADPDIVLQAVRSKFSSLRLLQRHGDESAAEQTAQFLQSLKDDPDPAMQQEFVYFDFLMRYAAASRTRTRTDKLELLSSMLTFANEGDVDERLFRLFRSIVWLAEKSGNTAEAVAAYETLATAAAKNDIEAIADYAPKLEGAARRLQLVGQPIEISGTDVDGATFDWEAYRGKVVLIDFWATWCGPCLRELPNLAEQYELYHDKGFEVVGISVDENREALHKFFESREIPWTTLHGATPETLGWNHPAAIRYGVMAIPSVILVDQEGIVVSLQARGTFLGMHLKKLLGPPRVEPVEAERPLDVAGAGE